MISYVKGKEGVFLSDLENVKEQLDMMLKFLIPNKTDLNKYLLYGKDKQKFIQLRNTIQRGLEQINKLILEIKKNPLTEFSTDEIRYYRDYLTLLQYFNIKGGKKALDKLAVKSDQGRNWEEMRMGYSSPREIVEDSIGIEGHYVKRFIKTLKSMSTKARGMSDKAIFNYLKRM